MDKLKPYFDILNPNTLAGAAMIALALIVAGIVLTWLMRRAVNEALHHNHELQIDEISLNFLGHLINLAIWILLLTLYAHLIPSLDRLANAMLAGVGLASVVIGFAAQKTLGNLVAGISLVLYRPFKHGDRLQIATPTSSFCDIGTVEGISLGFTTLRTDDGREIIVSNGTMAEQTMIKLAGTQTGPADGTKGKDHAATGS